MPPSASTVTAEVFCPHCCERVERPVRFTYGAGGSDGAAVRLGDRLGFGPGTPGAPGGRRRVVADGLVVSPCPRCAFDGDWPVEVWVEADRVAEVRPPSRRFNWVRAVEPYIVVEE